jgi:hypothetical protein
VSEVFGVNPTDAGAVALLVVVVLLILTGRLIPRRTHEDALADRDNWRQAYLQSEAARQVEHEQTGELLEMARISEHIITALPRPARDGGEVSGGDPVDPAPRTRL